MAESATADDMANPLMQATSGSDASGIAGSASFTSVARIDAMVMHGDAFEVFKVWKAIVYEGAVRSSLVAGHAGTCYG